MRSVPADITDADGDAGSGVFSGQVLFNLRPNLMFLARTPWPPRWDVVVAWLVVAFVGWRWTRRALATWGRGRCRAADAKLD